MHWNFIKQKRKSWNIVSLYEATSYNTLLVKLISLKNIFVCVYSVVPSINHLELVCSQTSAATLWTIRAFCDICLSHRDRGVLWLWVRSNCVPEVFVTGVCCDCEWEVTVYLRSLWDWHQSSRVISFVRPNLSSGTSFTSRFFCRPKTHIQWVIIRTDLLTKYIKRHIA